MASPKQRAANKANALKSTGPKSDEGKFRAKLNATKHGLSLPVNDRVFADLIGTISALIRDDCDSDAQAHELAKRIIDFERNEAYLQDFDEKALHDEFKAWSLDPNRLALAQLAQAHRNKQSVGTTFTTPQPSQPVKLKGKARVEEISFLEGFLKLQGQALLAKIKAAKDSQASALRYQKRAMNQLVKGVRMVAQGEDL